MSSPSPLSLSLDTRQTAEPAPTESTDPQAPPTKILIYQTLISFLKAACSARVSGRSRNQIVKLQRVLDGYLISMSSESVVDAVAKSLECRRTLLEFASEHGLTSDPDLRHSLRADEGSLVTHITSIFDSKAAEHDVLNLEGDSAQCFLDVIQDALDRGFLMAQQHAQKAHRIIRKLSEVCDKLPSSLFITGVSGRGEHPTFGGGFGSVYRASYDNKPVALKVMRHFVQGSELREIRVKLCREALIWKELHHPYILTFIGIDQDSFPSTLGMVSPWMEHGTILNYLNGHGRSTVDKLLFEIAQGLQYLHSRNIVHGDLRGANILISEAWTACLADFGLSALADTTFTLHSTKRSGSLYWMAPELIDPDRFRCEFLRTPASDVYAFGCVCVELYTGRPPFSEVRDIAASFKILNGERPQRPTGTPAMSDTLWQCVTEFWASNPPTRPSSKVVVQKMLWPTLEPDTEEDGSLHEEDSPKSPKNSEFGPRAYATPTSRDNPNNIASTKGEDVDIVGEPAQNRAGSICDEDSQRENSESLRRADDDDTVTTDRSGETEWEDCNDEDFPVLPENLHWERRGSPHVSAVILQNPAKDDPGRTQGETIATFDKHCPAPPESYQSTTSEDETTDVASTEDKGVDTGFGTGGGNGSICNEQSPAPADNSESVVATEGEGFPISETLRDVIRGEETANSILTLVERGADVNVVVEDGDWATALQLASSRPDIIFVTKLLNHGADPNICGGKYGTALIVASSRGHVENVKQLLAKGADPNSKGEPTSGEYGTALQAASFAGHIKVVQLLVEKGANINAQDGAALYAASYKGHIEVVQLVVEKGADINAQGGRYGTALQAASYEGQIEVIQLLVEKGADINARGGYYGTALQAASCWGYIEVIQLLVEKGVDVNAQGGYYGTALQAASYRGHIKVIQLLAKKGVDINAQGGTYGTALQAASYRGHIKIIQLLVEKGADVNAQGGHYGTALQAASSGGHIEVIQLLGEKGADVNAQGGRYGTALEAASSGGHIEVIQLLAEKGADINVQGGFYGTALQAASFGGYIEVIQLLVEKGADVNAQGGTYGTALHAASYAGYIEVIQLLIEKGADVNAQGGDYGTALQAASLEGHIEVIQLLVEKGADVNAQGGHYGTALQAASHLGHIESIQLLVEKGADVNAEGGRYGTALQAASSGGHTKVVQLLVEKGVDVNAQGGYYGTALQAASYRDHTEVIQLLVEKGADVNAQGGYYGTALQAASYRGHIEVIQLLVEKGADVNAQGGEYGTALQAASYEGQIEVIQLLVEKGADVNAHSRDYGTALQAASLGGHIEVVQLLVENGADINAHSGFYGTALQAASYPGRIEIIHLLVEKGADVNAPGGFYGTALQAASSGGYIEVIQLLVEKGADVNAQGGFYGTLNGPWTSDRRSWTVDLLHKLYEGGPLHGPQPEL